jgi:hypothetical protein
MECRARCRLLDLRSPGKPLSESPDRKPEPGQRPHETHFHTRPAGGGADDAHTTASRGASERLASLRLCERTSP